jgi:amidase
MALSASEYQRLDATALAQLIRNGDVSAAEVLEICTSLVEQHNPTLNAVIHKLYDFARGQLQTLPPEAPFAGVPMLLKDLGHHLAGTPLTAGNSALRDHFSRSEQTSYFVAKLASGGFLFPGKTNVPEFGLKGTTEALAFGPACNPWDRTRTPGGSSGGSAAMVAAGVVPVATANDGGGSIRIPASYCGLVGLKPSRGVVSNGPHYADLWDGLNADLVVTRSVRDTAAVLQLVAGNMPGDPYIGPAFSVPRDDTSPLRIALNTHPHIDVPVDASAIKATESMARLLQDQGHHVERAKPEISSDQAIDTFGAIYMSAAAADFRELQQLVGKAVARRGTEADTRFLAYLGECMSGGQYAAAKREINQVNREFGRFFQQYDLYLTPTTTGIAHPLGATAPSGLTSLASGLIQSLRLGRWVLGSKLLRDSFLEAAARVPYTQLANLSGLPAINIPAFRDEESGLPVGVMLTAALGGDALLLQVASALEAALPWTDHYPFMRD